MGALGSQKEREKEGRRERLAVNEGTVELWDKTGGPKRKLPDASEDVDQSDSEAEGEDDSENKSTIQAASGEVDTYMSMSVDIMDIAEAEKPSYVTSSQNPARVHEPDVPHSHLH